ncbi:hypothetical protein NM688_g6395 [Phlebia brevispora]|uniref:Uncharacterized protein n=1 Tax=Phlebia brevispora TaxID=194682 RepID=A0ACC1SGJ2_9APHY|nr:hypothetical protein NM688_g6395 [Phlebia brevispora]
MEHIVSPQVKQELARQQANGTSAVQCICFFMVPMPIYVQSPGCASHCCPQCGHQLRLGCQLEARALLAPPPYPGSPAPPPRTSRRNCERDIEWEDEAGCQPCEHGPVLPALPASPRAYCGHPRYEQPSHGLQWQPAAGPVGQPAMAVPQYQFHPGGAPWGQQQGFVPVQQQPTPGMFFRQPY